MRGALVNPNITPKCQLGDWVKFRTGKRTLRGCIVGWYSNSADAVIYEIARNKQTFRLIYEDNIIEVVIHKAN